MIFPDYPGHLVVILFLAASAGAIVLAFRSRECRKPELRPRVLALALLQYISIVLLLVILWNPSRSDESETLSRNSVLAVFDTSQSMSTVESGEVTRLDRALEIFKEKFHPFDPKGPEYKIFGFDREAYHSGSPDFLRRWGTQTDMQSVRALLGKYDFEEEARVRGNRHAGILQPDENLNRSAAVANSRVAGAVIFTDGQAGNKNVHSYLPLQRKDLPVVVIGVGSKKPESDIAIKSIVSPTQVAIDTAYDVQVVLTARNLGDQPIVVELLKDGQMIDSKQFAADAFAPRQRRQDDQHSHSNDLTVEFAVSADRLGSHTLSAHVKPIQQETNLANNQRSTLVEVGQEKKVKVLFYSQRADFNIGKIRQALARESKVDLDFGLAAIKIPGLAGSAASACGYARLPGDREGFCRYDVLILGPCDLNEFEDSQIDGLYSFVVDRGGGLILLPGRGAYGPAGWKNPKIRSLLPVILDADRQSLNLPDVGQIELTAEGIDSGVISAADLQDHDEQTSAFYRVVDTKPASSTLAVVQDTPTVSVHRVGRGKVCLLNVSRLYQWYRQDLEGGLLYRIMSGLTAYLGTTSHREAGVELFVDRVAEQPGKVKFSAYVYDKSFAPVAGANVLLNIGKRVLSMRQAGREQYTVEVEDVEDQTIVATAQAELNGVFLGEKTISANLPPARNEMTDVELDEAFLKALAERLGGRYVHIDDIEDNISHVFEARMRLASTTRIASAWPTWPLLLILCLLLSVGWFLRRAIGLV
jgi:predicted SpoU family rRNA methylase